MQSVDVLEYIDKNVLNKHKKSISNGEDKVIFENDNINITLKKICFSIFSHKVLN